MYSTQPFLLLGITEALQIPSKDAIQVLKGQLFQTARVFVISGYPRSTADLVHYLEHLDRIDGAILINWHDEAIQAQIDYGAREGYIKGPFINHVDKFSLKISKKNLEIPKNPKILKNPEKF